MKIMKLNPVSLALCHNMGKCPTILLSKLLFNDFSHTSKHSLYSINTCRCTSGVVLPSLLAGAAVDDLDLDNGLTDTDARIAANCSWLGQPTTT